MSYERTCEQCRNPFKANRSDAAFCSARCVAQYYRDHDNPEYRHAEKERIHFHVCDQCGQGYAVNDYAEREGQRKPRFCSNACKQAAYRGRVKQQAARRSEKGNNTKQKPPPNKGRESKKNQRAYDEDYFRQKHQEYSRQKTYWRGAKGRNPYDILGVALDATHAQIRAAFLKLAKQFHPDVYKGDDATAKMQDINWAYDVLRPAKKH